uniref:Uncharacterized protein n=1 Tax=Heterorhabditis bacteriophora TaxID=37862 RepID=A0A1I7XTA1_HETBA
MIKNRSRGEKPQPPAKPARLYRTVYPEQQEQYQSEPPTTSARFTLERDTQPTYRERATVALTITEDSNMLSRPQFAPPPPPKPPSRVRLSRIPSHLTPLTKPTVTKSVSTVIFFLVEFHVIILWNYFNVFRVRRKSSSEDDFYQKLPSPTKDSESCKLFQDCQTTEKNDIPRIPSIPPPLPPQSSKEEYSDDSLCYEQIDSTNECEVRMRYSVFLEIISSHFSVFHQPLPLLLILAHIQTIHMLRTYTATMRIADGEIALNATDVGQFRQRVGERRSRVAKCHLRADELETDGQIATREDSTSRDLDDDRYIYGDDWSSEEDGVLLFF